MINNYSLAFSRSTKKEKSLNRAFHGVIAVIVKEYCTYAYIVECSIHLIKTPFDESSILKIPSEKIKVN